MQGENRPRMTLASYQTPDHHRFWHTRESTDGRRMASWRAREEHMKPVIVARVVRSAAGTSMGTARDRAAADHNCREVRWIQSPNST